MHSHACHCEMCRRWTGSAFLGVSVAPGDLAFEDVTNVRTFVSSDWAERAFCGVCGSGVLYRLTAAGPMQGQSFVALGLFDEPDALPLASEIYIDCKPASFAFAGDRPRTTKAEFEAALARGDE